MTSSRYREVSVAGSPHRMGEQIGEALREEIRGFDAIAMERTRKAVAVTDAAALAVARAAIESVRAYAPHMLAELDGMARSSGVGVERLMLLQVRNQLQAQDGGRPVAPADAGCTAFALDSDTGADGAMAGQNWDNDAELDPFTVVLTRHPDGEPAFVTITQAGLIAYIGVSDAGIGVCLNTLPAPARGQGVPHYFTVRGIYAARGLEAAVDAVRRAERAIPANILLATPQGPADLEVTIDAVHVITAADADGAAGPGVVTHTNHCLHPDLAAIDLDYPELIESHPRKDRIDALLAASPRPIRRERLEAALRDHDNHPRSICRHPNDHPATGWWRSVFSVLIEADHARLHISRGNPCEHPYETYELS